jgi:hypothetical protein
LASQLFEDNDKISEFVFESFEALTSLSRHRVEQLPSGGAARDEGERAHIPTSPSQHDRVHEDGEGSNGIGKE